MTREQIAAKWLQASTAKIQDMQDLEVLQEARVRYIKFGPGFKMSKGTVAKLLDLSKPKNGKRRMDRLVAAGVFTRVHRNEPNKDQCWLYELVID